MRHLTRRTVLVSALVAPAVARAQSDYPNRPIRLVISWPPGASADAFLRSIADQAGKRLGHRPCGELALRRLRAKGHGLHDRATRSFWMRPLPMLAIPDPTAKDSAIASV